MNYREEIYKLKEKVCACTACPLGRDLVDGLDPHVFACGRVPSKIMLVGEAPGADEQKLKKPFVGRAGQFLMNNILATAELQRDDIYITNSIMCRPENNGKPLPAELKLCRPHLDAQIVLNDPKLIVAFGNYAIQQLCDRTGITKLRGKLLNSREWSNGKVYSVFPMFHPSYNLRGNGHEETKRDAETLRGYAKLIANGEGINGENNE
jgi:uracil-DNA glycosylase family 4